MSTVRFRETPVASVSYTTKWYEYAIKKLVYDIDNIHKLFPDKEYVSGDDILAYITTGEYGATHLIQLLKTVIGYLNIVEKQIIDGKWSKPYGVKIPKTLYFNINIGIFRIHKLSSLVTLLNVLYDDLYTAFFQWDNPDMEQNKPDLFAKYMVEYPTDFDRGIKLSEKNLLKDLLLRLIPYANSLELVHKDLINIITKEILKPLSIIVNNN